MRHISARLAPLPPSNGFMPPFPSVFLPNWYTYLPAFAAGVFTGAAVAGALFATVFTAVAPRAAFFAAFFFAILYPRYSRELRSRSVLVNSNSPTAALSQLPRASACHFWELAG